MSRTDASQPIRILLLEDSEMDADLIGAQLNKLGPDVRTVRAVDRPEYEAALAVDGYDVILSDYSLPGFDGMSALGMARASTPDTPFIFVSGVLGEEIAAESLKQGATDYVLKSRLSRLTTAVTRALSETEARTATRAAEFTLREREASYRALVDAIGTMVWTTQADGWLLDAPEWTRVTGQSQAESKGWGWLDVIHPEDRSRTQALWREAVDRRAVYDVEYRIRQADGGYRWYNGRGVPVVDDGAVRKWVGVCIDIHDRKQADDHLQLMVHELNHRVKNNLATVQAIAVQSLRETKTLGDAKADFTARLNALARAHDVLTRESWESATLSEMADAVLEPHCAAGSQARCQVEGPVIRISTKTALALSMALHELATNAVKYGAFSVPEGRVLVQWRVDGQAPERRLHLIWREISGPPVSPPKARGFGSRLIERGLAAELKGLVTLDFECAGVVCTIDIPLDSTEGAAP